mgnify:CR=1 FL=1
MRLTWQWPTMLSSCTVCLSVEIWLWRMMWLRRLLPWWFPKLPIVRFLQLWCWNACCKVWRHNRRAKWNSRGYVKTKVTCHFVNCRGRVYLPKYTKRTVFGRADLAPTSKSTALSGFWHNPMLPSLLKSVITSQSPCLRLSSSGYLYPSCRLWIPSWPRALLHCGFFFRFCNIRLPVGLSATVHQRLRQSSRP